MLFSAFNTSESEVSNSGNTLSSESEPNIAIQIEVDIEPPEKNTDGLLEKQLEKLGMLCILSPINESKIIIFLKSLRIGGKCDKNIV